jgi:Putative phage tail protein
MPRILQSGFIDGNGSNPTVLTMNVTSGTLLLIGLWHYNFGVVVIDDTFHLDWSSPNAPSAAIYRAGPTQDVLQIFYAFTGSHSGPTAVSITTISSASFFLIEVSGVPQSALPDSSAQNSGGSTGGGTVSSGSLVTTQPGDFIFALGFTGVQSTLSSGSGFTEIGSSGEAHWFGDAGPMVAEFFVAPSAGVYTATFQQNAAAVWMALAIAFKAAAVVAPNVCIPVGDIVLDVCKRAGIDSSLVDVSLLTSENLKPTNLCCGYLITRPTPAAQILQTLMQAFFFDICESDGKLKCIPRGLASIETIPEEDLGMEADKAKLIETQGQEQDLPRDVTVLYNDEDLDYQQGKQVKSRNSRIVSTKNQEIITLPLTTSRDFARQVAEKVLYLRWLERNAYNTNLWKSKYMRLDPTDVLQFVYEGMTFQIRVVDTSIGQGFAVAINGVGDNARNYLSSVIGGASGGGGGRPASDIAAPTLLFLFDIPLLRDVDSNTVGTGYYYAMSSSVLNWPGGVLFKSSDNAIFAFEDSDQQAVNFGSANNALGAPRSPWTWDYKNTLNVTLLRGALATDTELNVLNDSNALLVGGEVIQFQNAALEMDGSYTLSKLLRGRRGTELEAVNHAVGDLVIDLHSGMKRVGDPLSILNQLRYYRGVTAGQDPSLATSQQFTIKGNDLKPYAPVHVVGERDADSNLTLSWIRRTRIGGAWLDNVGTVPLSEASELYDVDVLKDGAVVRTFADLTSPTVSYGADEQLLDFGGTPQASIVVKVFQKSATVGRGFAGSVTV